MRVGQEGDTREYPDLIYDITKDIPKEPVDKRRHCEICKLEITGKSTRGSKSGKYVCNRCGNETA